MWEEIRETTQWLLGPDRGETELWHMLVRAVLVYALAVAYIRLGNKRFLGKSTAFDVILAIIFGSVMSRAITGNSPFFATIGAGLALVLLHWLFAFISYRSDNLGSLFKGRERLLIKDGELQRDEMSASHFSERDLTAALRVNAGLEDPQEVEAAYLERNGEISVLKRQREPRILEVAVRDGVQTVRIELAGD